jgi:hypothetical protein
VSESKQLKLVQIVATADTLYALTDEGDIVRYEPPRKPVWLDGAPLNGVTGGWTTIPGARRYSSTILHPVNLREKKHDA